MLFTMKHIVVKLVGSDTNRIRFLSYIVSTRMNDKNGFEIFKQTLVKILLATWVLATSFDPHVRNSTLVLRACSIEISIVMYDHFGLHNFNILYLLLVLLLLVE